MSWFAVLVAVQAGAGVKKHVRQVRNGFLRPFAHDSSLRGSSYSSRKQAPEPPRVAQGLGNIQCRCGRGTADADTVKQEVADCPATCCHTEPDNTSQSLFGNVARPTGSPRIRVRELGFRRIQEGRREREKEPKKCD